MPAVLEQGKSFSQAVALKQEIRQPESFHDGYVFRLDYAPTTPDAVLQNDITTYLEEYRLQVQKSRYEKVYKRGEDGLLALRSSDNGQAMVTLGRNAIQDRQRQGKSVAKETADLLGMKKMDEYMADAEEGDTIFWASPPDPTVGYEYGFFYVGEVKRGDGEEKKLSVAAIRLDKNPTLSQFNSALSLLTQEEVNHETVNEFISNPKRIKRSVSESEVDFVLKGTFDFERDSEEERKRQIIKQRMQPMIDVLKSFIREGAPEGVLRKTLFALENYSLELKGELANKEHVVFSSGTRHDLSFSKFMDKYSHVPPKVIGSCDTGGSTGPNMFGVDSIFSEGRSLLKGGSSSEKKTWGYTWGDCRVCEDKYTQVGPCQICKNCERKFD